MLPAGFDWQQAQLERRRPVAEWRAQGIVIAGGAAWPAEDLPAAILLPQGWRGAAFMAFDNFDVLMQWNRSTHYALSVAHLAKRIQGGPPLAGMLVDEPGLSHAQWRELQQALNDTGFDAGTADGIPGARTEAAIRRYQLHHQLPADGYASHDLLEQVARLWKEATAGP